MAVCADFVCALTRARTQGGEGGGRLLARLAVFRLLFRVQCLHPLSVLRVCLMRVLSVPYNLVLVVAAVLLGGSTFSSTLFSDL